MKILLLGFGNISHMPYMMTYLHLSKEHELHLIYWDRTNSNEVDYPQELSKVYRYSAQVRKNRYFLRKLPNFLDFRRFTIDKINTENYSAIIVMQVAPGMTIIDKLLGLYRDRYIVDFRDLSHEYCFVYKKMVETLVKSSSLTLVSSKGFLRYLPKVTNLQMSHNVSTTDLKISCIRNDQERDRLPIRIRFWGRIRHYEINKRLIMALNNDKRFELHYHGTGLDVENALKQLCRQAETNNVFFHGAYSPSEKADFAKETDFIHNLYNNDFRMKVATSNKIYDALIYQLPLLCTAKSYMGGYVERIGIGISLEPQEANWGDRIFKFYQNVNWDEFKASCKTALDDVLYEYAEQKKKIDECVQRWIHYHE